MSKTIYFGKERSEAVWKGESVAFTSRPTWRTVILFVADLREASAPSDWRIQGKSCNIGALPQWPN